MKYDVPLNKLIKIINPFEKKIFSDINEPFSKKLIEKLIKSGDIFTNEMDSIKETHMKKIAYEFSNYEEKIIDINLNLEYPLTSQAHYYVASVLKEKPQVFCDIIGDSQVIQKMGAIETHADILPVIEPEIFNWEVTHILTDKTWDNPKYVLEQMKLVGQDYKYNEDVKPYIDPILWEDSEFILDVIKTHQSVNYLPYKMQNSEVLFDIIKDDMEAFNHVWQDQNHSQLLETPFKDRVIKEIFNDVLKCRYLIENESDGTRYYKYFTDEIKMDDQVLTGLFMKQVTNGVWARPKFLQVLPKIYFQDIKNILDLSSKIKLKNLNETDIKPYHYEVWINDKNKIKFLFDNDVDMHISHFFKFLPKEFKKDPEVINWFLSKNPDAIYQLLKKEQKTPLMIQQYIDFKGNLELLENEVFLITDKKLIKHIVNEHSAILSLRDCPETWFKDDILIHASKKLHKLGLTKTLINNFVKDEVNRDYLKSVNGAVYSKLSTSLKLDKEWALKYIKLLQAEHFQYTMMANDNGLNIKEVSKELWNNKEFCLQAIQAKSLCMKMVPPQFFSEKKFSLKFFELIDEKSISKDCLSMIPAEIKKVLDALSINSDYKENISNFILNNSLHNTLEDKNTTVKRAKI